MLRFAVVVASMASVALCGVANFCVEEPFRQMQDFRDFNPAMERCALHYGAQTTTKTLPNICLTTTKTVILSTSTVEVTSHAPCQTDEPHLDIRAPAAVREAIPSDRTRTVHQTRTIDRTVVQFHTNIHTGPKTTVTKIRGTTKTVATTMTIDTTKTNPLPPTRSPTGSQPSLPARDLMDAQRRAGPTPVAIFKRDVAATQTAAWSSYYAALAECGYGCIQTACSCVGTLKVELKTPAPTCTSTLTKETILHQTKTIQMPGNHC